MNQPIAIWGNNFLNPVQLLLQNRDIHRLCISRIRGVIGGIRRRRLVGFVRLFRALLMSFVRRPEEAHRRLTRHSGW